MKKLILIIYIIVSNFATAKPIDHSLFTALLKKHVDAKGMVNYKGMKADEDKLKIYLTQLAENEPDKTWKNDEKLAYWINAYNAFTIKLILDHYNNGKLKSIKDIGSIIKIPRISDGWSIKNIKIGERELSLNNIENDIIRPEFKEARIHFALVCAAKSCPKLRNEAYEAKTLQAQLEDQTRDFLNDPTKNQISAKSAKITPLFDWYAGDFTTKRSVIAWLNLYAKTKVNTDASISFMDYDWKLNAQ
jgi:Protein of unknown function, DUF547